MLTKKCLRNIDRSLTYLFSQKKLERIVSKHLINNICTTNLIYQLQSAYLPGKSTDTAPTKVTSDILSELGNTNGTILANTWLIQCIWHDQPHNTATTYILHWNNRNYLQLAKLFQCRAYDVRWCTPYAVRHIFILPHKLLNRIWWPTASLGDRHKDNSSIISKSFHY